MNIETSPKASGAPVKVPNATPGVSSKAALTAHAEATGSLEDIAAHSKVGAAGDDNHRAYVGPPQHYDFMGATQFRLVTCFGLREEHSYLDIGCGSLRAGKLIIQYLLPDRYCGIEPNPWLIEAAVKAEIGTDIIEIKTPRFVNSTSFEVEKFGQTFDFIMAQSIFSHTGIEMFRAALAKVRPVMTDRSQFFFTAVTERNNGRPLDGTQADGWIYPEVVKFRTKQVESLCREAGIYAQPLPWFHPRQTWFRAVTRPRARLSAEQTAALGTGKPMFDRRFR